MKVKIKDIKANPNNPRVIRDEQFKKLVKSIQEFPEMLSVRKLVCTPDMIVLGGNMRLKALQSAGIKEVDVEIVDWDEQKQKEFIIKDNVSFGEWNHEQLANEWDAIELQEWGLNIDMGGEDGEKIDGEIKFSNELDYESNYIVLKFTKDIDFLQIESLLGLESTYSKRQNGKPWAKGRGRVVDGVDAIIRIKQG